MPPAAALPSNEATVTGGYARAVSGPFVYTLETTDGPPPALPDRMLEGTPTAPPGYRLLWFTVRATNSTEQTITTQVRRLGAADLTYRDGRRVPVLSDRSTGWIQAVRSIGGGGRLLHGPSGTVEPAVPEGLLPGGYLDSTAYWVIPADARDLVVRWPLEGRTWDGSLSSTAAAVFHIP